MVLVWFRLFDLFNEICVSPFTSAYHDVCIFILLPFSLLFASFAPRYL